ncbi:MAG TPA: hypothetical protein VGH17_06640 [Candidatus Acidoferrales bacterium]|jgi:hypothetical protein
MITRPGYRLSMFLAVLLIGTPALAFDDPLTTGSIRDAYMLGNRKDFKTAKFFASYRHLLPTPETGLHVAAISVETPYAQVVELGEAALNTDIQGAEEKWTGKNFPFIVRVGVDLTDTYPGPPPWNPRAPGLPLPNFESDFEIRLIQNQKTIPEQSFQVHLLYSDGVANTYQISGAIIELRYDTKSVDPYSEASVTVHTPDDQRVETNFDLAQLR